MAKIKDVRLDKNVEIDPRKYNSYLSEAIESEEPILLNPEESKRLIEHLTINNSLHVIENSLQPLIERQDGTKLLTAFPSAEEFINAVSGLEVIDEKDLKRWVSKGCNEININFEKAIA